MTDIAQAPTSPDEIAFNDLLLQANTPEDLETLMLWDPRSRSVGETALISTAETSPIDVKQTIQDELVSVKVGKAGKRHDDPDTIITTEVRDGKTYTKTTYVDKVTVGPHDKPWGNRRTGDRRVNRTAGRLTPVTGYSKLTPRAD